VTGFIEQYPALHGLGLDEHDLAALRHQGFVSREQRTPDQAPIHKLRYRIGGRQRTRYLGSDLELVTKIKKELTELQGAVNRSRKLQKLLRQARRGLRLAKFKVLPLLIAEGRYYHGFAIRCRRQVDAPQKSTVKPDRLRAGATEEFQEPQP
jgi:hypothetical protein